MKDGSVLIALLMLTGGPGRNTESPDSARPPAPTGGNGPAPSTTNGPTLSVHATAIRCGKSRGITWSSGPYSSSVGTAILLEDARHLADPAAGRPRTRSSRSTRGTTPRRRTARRGTSTSSRRERPRRRPEARPVHLRHVAPPLLRRVELGRQPVGVARLAHEVVRRLAHLARDLARDARRPRTPPAGSAARC